VGLAIDLTLLVLDPINSTSKKMVLNMVSEQVVVNFSSIKLLLVPVF